MVVVGKSPFLFVFNVKWRRQDELALGKGTSRGGESGELRILSRNLADTAAIRPDPTPSHPIAHPPSSRPILYISILDGIRSPTDHRGSSRRGHKENDWLVKKRVRKKKGRRPSQHHPTPREWNHHTSWVTLQRTHAGLPTCPAPAFGH